MTDEMSQGHVVYTIAVGIIGSSDMTPLHPTAQWLCLVRAAGLLIAYHPRLPNYWAPLRTAESLVSSRGDRLGCHTCWRGGNAVHQTKHSATNF